jgi:hydroxymethylbilane synthase
MDDPDLLRIGTRGSPLALAQAHETQALIEAAHGAPTPLGATSIVEIATTGDLVLDRPLADIGGKGLFSKEIDRALLDRRVDLAVHSMKDLETWMPDGIVIAAVLEREDVRDAFISEHHASLFDLPEGAVIGTASVRRQAQILNRRPDLKCVTFRGNVQTRLAKLVDGQADATILACAGLNRLNKAEVVTQAIDVEDMLPAVAQGAVAVTCRAGDDRVLDLLSSINHAPSLARVTAERAMLEALDGSCRTPIGGLATLSDDGTEMTLRGLIARGDGSTLHRAEAMGPVSDAYRLGKDLGERLKAVAGPGFLDDPGPGGPDAGRG